MPRCNQGYEFCEDGSEFEPLAEDSADTHPLTFRRLPLAA